jgi:hypothetical protein
VFRGTRHIDETTFKEIYGPKLEGGNVFEMSKGSVLLRISINDRGKDENEPISATYILGQPTKTIYSADQAVSCSK